MNKYLEKKEWNMADNIITNYNVFVQGGSSYFSIKELSSLLNKGLSTVVRFLNGLKKVNYINRKQVISNNIYNLSKFFTNSLKANLRSNRSKTYCSYRQMWCWGGIRNDSRVNAILLLIAQPQTILRIVKCSAGVGSEMILGLMQFCHQLPNLKLLPVSSNNVVQGWDQK